MPKTLQHAKQLAYISCRVIREIQQWQKFRQDSYLKKSNSLSVGLRDNIIRTIDSLQNVSNEAKNQISQFFVNGVEIKQPYMQNRVKLATENSKVIFIPTLMTSNVFNLLLCDPYLILVVDGHYGVSKSFSSILLSLLSRYISDYKILRYPYHSQPYYFWSQKNELSQFETEKNRQNINRYFYWRMDPEKDNVNTLHQSILQQLSPLEQQLIQRRRTGENRLFCDINHNLRRIGMEPFLIIDNLNSLLSKIRNTGYKHNSHYQGRYAIPQTTSYPTQYTAKRTNSHVIKYRQNFKKNIQSIRSLQECLYQAKYLYSFSASFLSVNAEQDLMKQIQLSDSQIYPIFKRIDFLRNYRLHIDDLTDFLIIVMENYSKIKISPMTKMQYKQKISEQITHNVTIKERILLTHLDIVHFCRSEVQYLKSIIEQKNAEKRSESLKQMIKKIKLHSENRFIDALKAFINKRAHHNENNHHETWIVKSLLISSIIQNLQAEDIQKLNHMEKIQYTLKQCRFVKSKYAVWIYKKIMDNRFFYIENDKVVIPFPSRIIKIASDKQFKRLLLETLMNYCADIVLQISPSGSARGGIIQNSFKYAALQSTEIKLCLMTQIKSKK